MDNKMWESERYEWSKLRACGDSAGLPNAIAALVNATDDASADAAYWRIDNLVVVQGAVYEAALPTVACLTRSLLWAKAVARERILELLVQICGGEAAELEVEKGNGDVVEACTFELVWCSSSIFSLLEKGSAEEREWCVDLLGLCARLEPRLVSQVRHHLVRHIERPDVRPELAKNWLLELVQLGV